MLHSNEGEIPTTTDETGPTLLHDDPVTQADTTLTETDTSLTRDILTMEEEGLNGITCRAPLREVCM